MVKQALVLSDTAGPRGLASVRVRRPRRHCRSLWLLLAAPWWTGLHKIFFVREL